MGLLVAVTVLLFSSLGWPLRPSAALYAAGLVGVLFVSGLGYLHALGAADTGEFVAGAVAIRFALISVFG